MKLEERIKELIAIGASVTANCQPCLQYHVDKAMENGANEQEVKEAIEVAKMVRKGAAAKMDKFAEGIAPSAVGSAVSSGGCGCSS
ncbi:MAG: carboxymuconolactone decarboxylase family protein [Thermodesulfovibrio sp.]|nr:carboxymuconolactone decarboxylase family protein [Thermodesulfovibrio sp.]